jgi:diguanylate cyclase (GGDEF)-like protein
MSLDRSQVEAVTAVLPDPLFVITESGFYADVLGGGDSRFYHDGSSLVGRSLYEVLPGEKADWIMEQVARVLREGTLRTVEYALSGADVEGLDAASGPSGEIWFEGRIQPLPFPIENERAVVWVARNITRSHELEAKLRRLSERDELTGALNRRKLIEALGERCAEFSRYGVPTSLLMLDIDHFKRINDRFGHVAGDRVLRAMAQVCMEQLRHVDSFYRFGGEEFVALLPHTDRAEARATAERLRLAVERNTVEPEHDAIRITVSIGLSALEKRDKGFESLIKRADDALYVAKRNGRNRVVADADG